MSRRREEILQEEVADLTEALMDCVAQACDQGDGTLDSMALSAYAHALHLLAKLGIVRITGVYGRRVTAVWVQDGAVTYPERPGV